MSYGRLVGFGWRCCDDGPTGRRLETTSSVEGSLGGASLNACIAAVRAGMPATRVSAFPRYPPARRPARARHHLRQDRREFVGSDGIEPRVCDVSRGSP